MEFDLNLIRNIVTVAAFAAFLGIVGWAYAPRRKGQLDEHAQSILKDEQ